MKNFKVKVITPGMIFLPAGKKVRCPATLKLNEAEVKTLMVQFKQKGLKYEVDKLQDTEEEEKPRVSKRVVIEELVPQKPRAEADTFLDKLIEEEEK